MSAQTHIAPRDDLAALPARRAVALWLFAVAALIFLMVLVGGLTRLTESGLSITEWKPVMGALPPLSQADWQGAFEKYRQIPQYEFVNKGMSLGEFKTIFWWEWSHRFLGRLIGFAFLLPFLWLLATRRIERAMAPRLAIMFVLGGLQGALGWWMVKSGLTHRVDVSQYRLTAHLGLAAIIYGFILWTALGLWRGGGRDERRGMSVPSGIRNAAWALVALVFVQILLGGLVAGLKAGYIYNTWPLMEGAFIPAGLFAHQTWWLNFFENMMTVQFQHRMTAYLLAILVFAHWLAVRRSGLRPAIQGASWLCLAVLAQIGLGIWTLLAAVPIPLGAAHQAGALIVFTLSIVHAQEISRSAPISREPARI